MARKPPGKFTTSSFIIALIYLILQHLGFLPGPTSPTYDKDEIFDTAGLPKTANSFSGAKKSLYEEVYQGHEKTFYCDCNFDPKKRKAALRSCGVKARQNKKRAGKIEAEHVMPAYRFGNGLKCWQKPGKIRACKGEKSGRQCCEKYHPVFETAHNDLHNLFPAVGEINGDRSNYSWAEIPGEKREYGKCDIEIDEANKIAEPPMNRRGDIARVYFYMEKEYGKRLDFSLSESERQLFTQWAKQDKPDRWEYERNERIRRIQGRGNPFITLELDEPNTVPDERTGILSGQTNTFQNTGFSCEVKKACAQMNTCEEALYHLNICGNKRLDRDGDGVPCTAVCGG